MSPQMTDYPLKASVHKINDIETSQLMYTAKQLTGFFIVKTLGLTDFMPLVSFYTLYGFYAPYIV